MSEVKMSHPRGLYSLFFTEMWERFSYYGMRALLVLYLTAAVMQGGFGLDRTNALEIYALFTGLVYLTPILGGLLADKVLGQRKAIFVGGILMAIGQFCLAASAGATGAETVDLTRNVMLNTGLGLLIMGNGFFKPNISTIVGALYESNDPRKDSAFTIFYMGINLGAFLSPLVAGSLGEKVGWQYGFSAAGVGMMVGLLWFYLRRNTLGDAGYPPNRKGENLKLVTKDYIDILLYVAANIVFVIGFLQIWDVISANIQTIITWIFVIGGTAGLIYTITTGTSGSNEWSRVGVILILCVFNIFFWAGFEQAGGTFNLFAAENTNRMLFNWEIPASYFQSINAMAIFIFAPIFSLMWLRLDRINLNPNTPVKFGFGLILLALGFVVMHMASTAAQDGSLVSPMWLVSVYLLHTFGELCISPIGLSMITKLAPAKIVSVMMGLWFASTALANYVAGILERLLHDFMPTMPLFKFLTISSALAGAVVLLLSPWLKQRMRGIK